MLRRVRPVQPRPASGDRTDARAGFESTARAASGSGHNRGFGNRQRGAVDRGPCSPRFGGTIPWPAALMCAGTHAPAGLCVSARRRAPPGPGSAPRPPPCRPAGSAARATARPCSAAPGSPRARRPRSRPPARPGRRGAAAARDRRPPQGADRVADGGVLVAEHEQPLGRETRERRAELLRLRTIGDRQDAALLGGLDGVGAQAVHVDPLALRVAGDDRADRPGAHLDRFWAR